MTPFHSGLGAVTLAAGTLVGNTAQAASQSVSFSELVASATVEHVFEAGDILILNTLAIGQTGALDQSVTFTIAPDVGFFTGFASWFVNDASRLSSVNIVVRRVGGDDVAYDSYPWMVPGTAASTLYAIGLGAAGRSGCTPVVARHATRRSTSPSSSRRFPSRRPTG